MDLKAYYKKVREVEQKIKDDYVIIVSKETNDGGQTGVMTEVSRALAARLIVDGKARLAREEEKAEYQRQRQDAKQRAERKLAASRVPLMILTVEDLKKLKLAEEQNQGK